MTLRTIALAALLGTTAIEPHVKVEFVDARGNKVGSLLSVTLPAGRPACRNRAASPCCWAAWA